MGSGSGSAVRAGIHAGLGHSGVGGGGGRPPSPQFYRPLPPHPLSWSNDLRHVRTQKILDPAGGHFLRQAVVSPVGAS